jgi:ketosteroid isomerase-like protein
VPTANLADTTRWLYGALLDGRVDDALALIHPDIVLHVPGDHPLAGEHRGIDAFVTFQIASAEVASNTQEMRLIDVMGGTDHAAAYVHVTAQREGRAPLDNLTVHLFRFEDGRVVDLRFHNWDDRAVSAFWA